MAWWKTFKARKTDFRKSESGNIAIVAAVSLASTLAATALAVDLGAIHLQRRQNQGAVDLAAMAAASDLAHAQMAAVATLRANGIANTDRVTVELGHYVVDAKLAPAQRFVAGQSPSNAVRVTMKTEAKLFFARSFSRQHYDITVSAVSSCDNLAAFSIGSRLLAVRGGTLNALLGALLGTNVQLSAMDYNALGAFNVQAFSFLNALAIQLNVKGGTYDDVLNSDATVGDVIAALGHAADSNADIAVISALNRLPKNGGSLNAKVDLTRLVSLGPLGSLAIGDPSPGLDAAINTLQLIDGAAAVANGNHQVSVDLGATIPGLLSLTADVAIGEPIQHSPMVAVGDVGSVVRTAQTRLRLIAQVAGVGPLSGASIRLPIYLDLAYAEGQLSKIACHSDGTGSVDVAATPGVAQVWIGEVAGDMTTFESNLSVNSAKLVDVSLAKVYGKAEIDAGNTSPTTLTFSPAEIGNGTVKQVDTDTPIESIVTSLIGKLSLSVQVAGVNLGLGSQLKSVVLATLNNVAAPLDTVVDDLLTGLGVHLGEADMSVDGVRCRGNGMLAG